MIDKHKCSGIWRIVTNNWFNDLYQPNHFIPYGTAIFSLDGEKMICFLIWCVGDHNHVSGFKPIRVSNILLWAKLVSTH